MNSSVARGASRETAFEERPNRGIVVEIAMEVPMRSLRGAFLCSLLLPGVWAQQAQPPAVEMRDGGTSVQQIKKGLVAQVLESIYIPAITGAPFTAIVHTEWVRYVADGGTFTLVNQRPIARDSEGRIYQERWILVPKNGRIASEKTTIQIGDPNAHTLYNCFIFNKPRNCTLERFNETTTAIYKPAMAKSGPLLHNEGYITHEDLGKDSIEGIEVTGTRDTITYNEGAIGNDRPESIKREFWYAPSLGINLRSEVSDPDFGKQIFTITDISLSEPAPGLYEPPAGFKVEDCRKPAAPQE